MTPAGARTPFRLDGQVAVVTGGARGIGAAVVSVLVDAGARVMVLDTHPAGASSCESVEHVTADVSDPTSVRRAFARLDESMGQIDILVNNAGVNSDLRFEEISFEEWDRVLATNARGSFLCAQEALARMKHARRGRIIQITSVVAQQGALFGQAHYAASKSAQLGLTKTLSRAAAPFGVTVNAVAPGVIGTSLVSDVLGHDRLESLAENIPLGVGAPIDVAYAVLYLASAQAAYVTGATLDVNGGLYQR